MISLRLLVLVLVTLGCREWADGDAQIVPLSASLGALGVSLGFGLLFKVSALRLLSAHGPELISGQVAELQRDYISQRCSRMRARIQGGWLLCLPLALLATGWGPALNSLQEAGVPQAVTLLGWFAPSLFLILLLELTAAQFDELCQSASGASQFNDDASESTNWPREWLLRLRLGEMASLVTCLVPVLLIAGVTDAVRYFADDVLLSRLLLAGTLVAFGLVILFTPVWLGKWMGLCDFPTGQLRDRIEGQVHSLRLRGIEPRLLRSRGRWPGAAIVGWFPGFRQLWLGDALIDRLTPRQLDMVVMHELAHVTGWHFLWRVLPMAWAVGIIAIFNLCWPAVDAWAMTGTMLSTITACVVMLTGMSGMAHRCELEADRTACQLAEETCVWARAEPGQAATELAAAELAAAELAAALKRLLSDSPQAAAASWLHPSLQQRLRNLG